MKWVGLMLFLCFLNMLHGQNEFSGTISEMEGNATVVGATLQLNPGNKAAISDAEGHFRFDIIDSGKYTLVINALGFTEKEIEIELNGSLHIDIELEEKIFDLPDIVIESITMTGGLSGVGKSLGSAHFIDQKEIQRFSYTDINRTLRNIPGTNIQEEDGYGLRPNIGLRATGSERSSKITVMEDGILAAPAPYAAPAAYYFPTIGRMEAIEILKGSSQIKYGPFTTGGAINFISTPIPMDFSGHADLIAGSDGYKMLHANLGNAYRNVAFVLETLQYGADGFKNLDNQGNTGFNKSDYLAKVRFNTNPDAKIYQSLTLKMGWADETSNETYLGLTDEDFDLTPLRRYAGSQNDIMRTEHSQISLSHFVELAPFLDIYTSVYKNDFKRNWYKLDKVGGQKINNILQSPALYASELATVKGASSALDFALKANNRSYVSEGIQTNLIFHFSEDVASHKIDLGLRWHNDQIDRFQWVDFYRMTQGTLNIFEEGIPGTESNRISDARTFASYLQYKLTIDKVTLTTGLRYEDIIISRVDFGKEDTERAGLDLSERSNSVNVVIPGIAASYEITSSSSVFGGVHKGFAPPGSKEGTNPEESWNYEFGYRLGKENTNVQVLFFHNDYSNLLGSDLAASGGSGNQDLFNGGAAIAQGIESQVNHSFTSGVSGLSIPVFVNYTYSKANFGGSFESSFDAWGNVEEGDWLPYVPRHQIAYGIGLEHDKMLFDLSARHSSSMLTQAGQFSDDIERTDEAFTIDVAVNYMLTDEISAFANVNNLTNNLYIVSRRPAGVRPNQPRTIKVGLKVNF